MMYELYSRKFTLKQFESFVEMNINYIILKFCYIWSRFIMINVIHWDLSILYKNMIKWGREHKSLLLSNQCSVIWLTDEQEHDSEGRTRPKGGEEDGEFK